MKAVSVMLLGVLLSFVVSVADAQSRSKQKTQASLVVSGHVSVEADGHVSSLEIDQREKLPSEVAEIVERTGSKWRFEPYEVDGTAVPIKARMRVRLVADELDDGDFEVSVRSAHFGLDALVGDEARRSTQPTDVLRVVEQKRTHYPSWALDRGHQGTVYVYVRVDRSGDVAKAAVEQINLRHADTPARMSRAREEFGKAVLKSITEWAYQIPTTGADADRPYWEGRITVDFTLDSIAYGDWQVYVPGPVQRIEWAEEEIDPNSSPDVMAAGGGFEGQGKGLKLLTPLDGS